MDKTTYEPLEDNLEQYPATKADVEKILKALEALAEQIKDK